MKLIWILNMNNLLITFSFGHTPVAQPVQKFHQNPLNFLRNLADGQALKHNLFFGGGIADTPDCDCSWFIMGKTL